MTMPHCSVASGERHVEVQAKREVALKDQVVQLSSLTQSCVAYNNLFALSKKTRVVQTGLHAL